MIAIALTRKGTVLEKMAKLSKDYELAIQAFQKALSEHHNPDTLKKLNDAEKAKSELEQQEYFDTKLADEEHEKGTPFENSWTFVLCMMLRFVSLDINFIPTSSFFLYTLRLLINSFHSYLLLFLVIVIWI